MKKFIACLLVVSLLLSVTASAAGVDDTYTVDEDVTVVSMLAASADDYAVMPLADSSGWTTELDALNAIDGEVFEVNSRLSSVNSWLSDIFDQIDSVWTRQGTIIEEIRDASDAVTGEINSTNILLNSTNTLLTSMDGLLSDIYGALVDSREAAYLEYIDANIADLFFFFDPDDAGISLLDVLLEADDDTVAGLTTITNRLANSTGDFLNANGVVGTIGGITPITTLVRLGFLGLGSLMRNSSGEFLNQSGVNGTISGATSLTTIVRYGFVGLGSLLRSEAGSAYLTLDGTQSTLSGSVGVGTLLRNGFLGLRSTIAGSETDNVYNGTITSNENVESSFTATGLGPMLNKWLDAVQLDTGRLSYMFASPSDLEAKKKSESTTQAATDSFLDPESDSSVSVDDIGSISGASKNIQQLGQTGVSPDLAFDQLSDSALFGFFSQEVANNLNTVPQTLSDDPDREIVTNYYQQNRIEFLELIGKED